MTRNIIQYLSPLLLILSIYSCGTGEEDPKPIPVPDKITLLSPTNHAQDQSTALSLNWKGDVNAKLYHIQVSTNSNIDSLIVDKNNHGTVNYLLNNLVNDTVYYWRVRGINEQGSQGTWSNKWSFTTISAPLDTASTPSIPTIPSLSFPLDNAQDQSLTLTLEWNTVSNATTYDVQLSTNNAFSSPIVDTTISTSSYKVNTPLTSVTQYYWRVRGMNEQGSQGTWSNIWSFTTISASLDTVSAPTIPSLSFPLDNAQDQPLTLTLKWNTSPTATEYEVQLSTSTTFSSFIVDTMLSQSSYRVNRMLNPSTQYYWRVRGSNSVGKSGWSEVWSFTTVSGSLLITEVGNVIYSDVRDWIEIYNKSSSLVDLSKAKLKAFSGCNINFDVGIIEIQSVMYNLPNIIMKPKSYIIIEFPFHIYEGYPDDNFENTDQTIFVSNQQVDGTGCRPYIHESGEVFFELVLNGITEDYIVTQGFSSSLRSIGIDSESFDYGPTTGSFSGGIPKLAIPSNSLFISSGRDKDNTDTDSGSDWVIQSISTYGGPNDITSYVDSDEDGIPDEAEMPGGTFAGLPLYEWGARVNQKDVFIHVDYMENTRNIIGLVPRREALQKVVNVFKKRNIHLHIDVGDLYHSSSGASIDNFDLSATSHEREYSQWHRFRNDLPIGAPNVYVIKHDYFPNARKNIFHYAFFAHNIGEDVLGRAEIKGNDFVVSVAHDRFYSSTITQQRNNAVINLQSMAFMHELGHNLGLEHGGNESLNYKPNYFSIMNYMYSEGLPSIDSSIGDRYYYFKEFDKYRYRTNLSNNFYDNSSQFIIDYSDGSSIDLDERQLVESQGIGRGNQGIDWNIDGTISTANVAYDLNLDNQLTVIRDHDDWDNLLFDFNGMLHRLVYFKGNLKSKQQKQYLPPIYNDYQPLSPSCIFPIIEH